MLGTLLPKIPSFKIMNISISYFREDRGYKIAKYSYFYMLSRGRREGGRS